MQRFDDALAVVQQSDSIGYDDHIKWARQRSDTFRIFDITLDEVQVLIFSASDLQHTGAEIDAYAKRWLERIEQVAGAAADFQHPEAGPHLELHVSLVIDVKELDAFNPSVALPGDRVSP